ncbi:MAG: hypothetical protein ACYTJ0_04745, partial [Planctomycetota bacterium]
MPATLVRKLTGRAVWIAAAAALTAPARGADEPTPTAIIDGCLQQLARQRATIDREHAASGTPTASSLRSARDEAIRSLLEERRREAMEAHASSALDASDGQSIRLADGFAIGAGFALGAVGDDAPAADATGADGDEVGADEALARAAQNPIADLISLPFQNNTNIDFGRLNYEQNVLNIQPVIPFHLNDDWNLITRTIAPVVYQPAIVPGDDHDFGLGDVQFTGFLVPTRRFAGWMIGAGPVVRLPTATDARLGARKWAIGPSAVALRFDGPWVVGALAQQVWSVAGSGDSNVSELLVQPFVNYNIPDGDGWYLTTSPIITANWMADDSDDRWTVP